MVFDNEIAEKIKSIHEERQRPKGLPTLFAVASDNARGYHMVTHHGVSFEHCPDDRCMEAREVLRLEGNNTTNYGAFDWQLPKKPGEPWRATCCDTEFYAHRCTDILLAESRHFVRFPNCPSRHKSQP
jgi:hypothetical protein